MQECKSSKTNIRRNETTLLFDVLPFEKKTYENCTGLTVVVVIFQNPVILIIIMQNIASCLIPPYNLNFSIKMKFKENNQVTFI